MTDLLYDYHLALSLPSKAADYRLEQLIRQEAVLRKYNLSRSQFEDALKWYERHPSEMIDVYDNIEKRFALATAESPSRQIYSTKGDTANVWTGPASLVLSATERNYYSFNIRTDTAWHCSDRLEWQFDVDWFYGEGSKSLTAMIVLHYEGDSLVTRQFDVWNGGNQSISLETDRTLSLREVSGYIYQKTNWSAKPRLAVISNILMLRKHDKNVITYLNNAETVDISETSDSAHVSGHSSVVSNGDVTRETENVRPVKREKFIRDSLLKLDKHEGDHFSSE